MLYSLPSRELIADSVEYMVNAHCADAMICISNCDKITPGMLLASMRLNIPSVFVSGGPMESGKIILKNKKMSLDLVDAILSGVKDEYSKEISKEIEDIACPTCGSCSGMFTANSMNCLVEAIGLSLPGNGTILATHIDRKKLFVKSAKRIVKITKSFYENDNFSVLPRMIANKYALNNAMIMDIAMGGSTNTILHLLAIAQEGKVDFSMKDINQLAKKVPNLCKISPNSKKYHMEDFHRAGGVMGILSELNKINLLNVTVKNILGLTLKNTLKIYDILSTKHKLVLKMFKAGPKGQKTIKAFSQNCRWKQLDVDRKNGCIRSSENAYSKDGGLAILYGNIAKDGCVVKTAGVLEKNYIFSGKARVYESQEEAVNAILNLKIKKGEVIVIRYEGPKGGPGMQEMLYPTTYLKSTGMDEFCALITDGRFSGGTSGLSIGHISPEAANKGVLALVRDGDTINIDIPNRSINVMISILEVSKRKKLEELRKEKAYTPQNRVRRVSTALKVYAKFATSANMGAVRDIKVL